MDTVTRQTVLLIAFTFLLVAALLFLFVYAPEPLEPLQLTASDIWESIDSFFTWVGDSIMDFVTE